MCPEHDVYMVFIVVPFLKCNMIIRRDILKYLLYTVRNGIIQDVPSIVHYQDQMVIQ